MKDDNIVGELSSNIPTANYQYIKPKVPPVHIAIAPTCGVIPATVKYVRLILHRIKIISSPNLNDRKINLNLSAF